MKSLEFNDLSAIGGQRKHSFQITDLLPLSYLAALLHNVFPHLSNKKHVKTYLVSALLCHVCYLSLNLTLIALKEAFVLWRCSFPHSLFALLPQYFYLNNLRVG